MKAFTKKIDRIEGCVDDPTASIADGFLVMSLPNAIDPVVWRMDLSQAKSSAIEAKSAKGKTTLTVKTPTADIHDIASFTDAKEAKKALAAIMTALSTQIAVALPQNQNTKQFLPALAPQYQKSEMTRGDRIWDLVKLFVKGLFVLGALYIVLLFFSIFFGSPYTPTNFDTSSSQMPQATSIENIPTNQMLSPTQNQNGVPLSAEDFLRN